MEDAVCRRNKPMEATIGTFRHTKLRLDEEIVDGNMAVCCEVQSLPSKIKRQIKKSV